MTTMTKARAAEIQTARAELRETIAPGDQITVLQRHVARSGMTRWLDGYVCIGEGCPSNDHVNDCGGAVRVAGQP